MKRLIFITFFLFFISARLMAADYYWVKGTGIWSDLNHWATTSGGAVFHFTVPTARDNVHFDNNSFTAPNQVVTITFGGGIANVVCKNMDWTGANFNPTLFGNSIQTLRIYGSLTLIPAMTFSFSGVVYFEATTSGNTITSEGQTFHNDVVFQGTGGWTLNDQMTTTSSVQLTRGILSTNSKTVNCRRFISAEGNVRNLNISGSLIKITGNSTTDYSWDVNGTSLNFNAVDSQILIDGGEKRLRHTGTSVQYNNLKVLQGIKSDIVGGDSRFNLIQAGDALANAPANLNLSSVHFANSIMSYSSGENTLSYDSVKYIRTSGNLTLNNGDIDVKMVSFSGKVITEKDAIIQSNNKIDSLWVYGNATISKKNLIRCDSIFGDATFNGDSNDFGRLVVMGNSSFTGTNKVDYCALRGNGTFENINTFNSLYFSPGKIYKFGAGDTVTINNLLSMPGLCTGAIILQSTVTGTQGILRKSLGPVVGDYLSLRDIKAEGGATFTANSSVDLGNNTGWTTITPAASLSLYWIGGTGNWDDPAHWSLFPGVVGGACLPTANDDVFFNVKSFTASGQTVTINIGNAVCRNMTWTGAQHKPTLKGPKEHTLHIYGSLTLISAMTQSFSGVVYFEAATLGNTITSGGQTFQNDVVFQGTGAWLLKENLTTISSVHLTQGSLSSNGKTINCKRFLSTEGNIRILNIAGSLINITGNNTTDYSWEVNGTGLTFNSGGSQIVIEGGEKRLHHTGTSLQYNNIKLLAGTNSNIEGGGSRFNLIQSGDALANAPDNMNLSLVQFADSIVSYSSVLNTLSYESVNYLWTSRNLILNNGDVSGNIVSFSGKVISGQDATVKSNNKIDSLWVYGNATINQNNRIRYDSIIGDATFNGLTNDFGRLIVMGNSRFSGTNNVEYCVLKGNSTFENANTFDSLYLSPGRIYKFGAGQTTTINKVLSLNGTCTKVIILESTIQGVQGSISKSSGAVVGKYLSLRDIKAMGGATFLANNSVDLGNNSLNWTIITTTSQSLYWIGGTGNWDDPTHWSSTSGGVHMDECLPTAIDDVFFDEKSFTADGQRVTINIGNAVCHNMTWTGAQHTPTFTGPALNDLHIYGSLTLISAMTHSFSGVVYFEATTTGNTITCGGRTFQNDVVFQGIGGEWTLNDQLTSASSVKLMRGSLVTNGKTINCKQFLSTDGNIRSLNISGSLMNITGNSTTDYSWNVNGTNLIFNSAGSQIVIEGGDQRLRHTGIPLQYNNVKLLNGVNSNIVGGGSRFNQIQAGDGLANAPNNLNLSTVHFANSIVSYSSLLNTLSYDSVKYIRTSGNLTLNNGDVAGNKVSFSGKMIIGKDAIIQSNNKIDSLWIYGKASINKNNRIRCDSIFGDAIFNGLSNDFGRLVVMGNSSFKGINKVEHCVLLGNGTFENVNSFDLLYLSRRKIYEFGSGDTVTINKVLSLPGLCTGVIILQSTVAGEQAILYKSSGTVVGNYLSLRDIKAEGGATFIANNSVDLGNNSGWTIKTAIPLSLFWVGGIGNWDDPAHWALTSGGFGGACLPTANDDVYFDAKSFTAPGQTVTINIGNAVCRNMTWTGANSPIFTGPGVNNLHIYGSLTLIPAMIHSFAGLVFFEAATAGNIITSGGKTFQNDVVFQGTGGWILKDSLTTIAKVQLTRGSLNTKGNTINCRQFISVEENNRNLNISNSVVKVNNSTDYSWDVSGTGLTFNSAGSLLTIEGGDKRLRHTGNPLQYNNVKLLNGINSTIVGGDSRFNIIQSGDSLANAPDSLKVSSVRFANSIVSYSSVLNTLSYDSVNYVRTSRNLKLNNGDIAGKKMSFSGRVIAGQDADIQSNNKIDRLQVNGNASINQNNRIRSDSIFGDATFNGSSNDFGRLVVMGNSLFKGTNKVEHCVLKGSGTFENINTFDSLYLSPGRLYEIRAGDTVNINRVIQIRGNNCFPLQLRSTIQGQQATLLKSEGNVSGDFLELRDINAIGGANFYAGGYSTNMGNNTGWIFSNTPGYVFGLGADREICMGESLVTSDFNGASSYIWQDRSTNSSFKITTPGLYWVKAIYAEGCSYTDSIKVITKPVPVAQITVVEPYICSGNSVQLEGVIVGEGLSYSYSWEPAASLNDSFVKNPVAKPDVTTDYIFSAVSTNGCSSRDTLRVNVAPPIIVSLTKIDPLTCISPTGTSTATTVGGLPFKTKSPYTYEWNTTPVQNSANVTGLFPGSYVVTATDSLGCKGRATTVIKDPGTLVVSLSLSSEIICPGEVATATATGASLYEFFVNGASQGIASSKEVLSLTGFPPGVYKISVLGTRTGCTDVSEVLSLTVPESVVTGLGFTINPTGAVSPGELLTFSATPVNGGSAPKYQWLVNGEPVPGATEKVFESSTLTNKDALTCRMISNAVCVIDPEVLYDPYTGLVPSLIGSSSVCAGSTGVTYTTEPDMTGYSWVVSSGGIITSGDGSNAITVTWNGVGDQTIMVNYIHANGKAAKYATVQNITVNPLPVPTIIGSANMCIGAINTYTTELAMTDYVWNVSPGGTIIKGAGTDSLTVNWKTIGNQIISLNYVNANGCTSVVPAIQNVTVNPLPVPTILKTDNTWIGASYTYITEALMTDYTWSVTTGGTITSGAETNEVTIQWLNLGWQTLSINYVNANGCAAKAAITQEVKVINPPLTISQGFSPNGDGLNDKLFFGGLENYPGSKIVIFTRSGQTVYESDDYLNEWDGTFQNNGSKDVVTVSCGIYYYVLKLGGTKRNLKGFIYVGY